MSEVASAVFLKVQHFFAGLNLELYGAAGM